jgi:hypothetical protein
MSEFIRKAIEKTIILKKKPHLKPPASSGVNVVGQHRTRQALRRYLREANPEQAHRWPELPDIEDNGQFKLLTRGRLGMRLKEFRYYQPPGGYYGNPYDKDFAQERQKERRHGLIKAGIVGAGLLGGGALLGRGLYKVGNSGAVRRAEDLAEELSKLRASKAAANVGNVGNAAPAPRGRKTQNNTPPPAPSQTPTPTPPPQTPPSAPPTPPTGKKTTPKKVVENLNQQGDLPAGTAAAEIDEITAAAAEAAKPPRKLTARQQKLANRQAKVAKFAAAQSGGTASVPSTPAPAAPAAVVPKTKAPVAAKTPAAPKPPVKTQAPTKPVASATNQEFWEKKGVGKVPLTGTPEQNAALRKRLEDTHAAGGFNGKVAADVIDEARASLKPKSDFPEGLSDKLRAAGKENNPKAKKKSKAKKQDADEADDLDDLDEADDINEPDASAEEADWEAKLKENPQVRAKKSAAKSDSKKPAAKAAAKTAAKPAAKSKKGKKEADPLSFAERVAAQVKARRDKKKGKNLSALLQRVRYFNQFQTDEAGIPLTGRVARDRFVKKLRDEDLDRRDANILRAGGAGALAGLLARGRIGASKRALIGAGAGGLGVIGIRALTNNDRDIYGERDRGSKRAEILPAVGGLGAAAWLAGKRLKAFAKKIDHRGHGGRGGVKEFVRGDYMAKLLPSERFEKRVERGVPYERVLPAPEKRSGYSKYVADRMRAVRRFKKLLSARLRGMKNFDDYRLYYFKGRNTGIAARSAEEARKKKKRGGDELVAVRTPSDSEKSQMARGVWVRTRRDGKSPGQSRYGKGRGQGPARKSLSARFDHNQAPGQAGGRATEGWPRRGETRGSERVKGHRGHGEISGKLREFAEKREKGMNPYVGAALSGFGSGAALGSLALLRRGATFRGAAKTAGKLGLASAGIVGGGALLGSKIVGDPRKEESAPFMKRAAIGGTLVGAGAGLGGALLLRRTSGGARALVAASKKSEPFSRPAMWLRKAPLAGAAGIGAVGGALYGGGMGLDEGQQVDSIRNLRKDMKNFSAGSKLRQFSAKLRFFGRGDQARWDATRGGGLQSNEDSQFANVPLGWATDRPMYIPKRDSQGRVQKDPLTGEAIRMRWDPSSGQLWNSIAREAKNKRVTVQRGGRLSRDVVDELRGAPRQRDASGRIKKREWEKSWFHNKATEIGMTAAGLGGLATVRYANNNPDTKIGKAYTNTQASLRATKDGLSEIGKNILGGITKITAKRAFSAKLKKLRELDAIAEYEGWDVRDPRGRSARVFAPGSRKRERRPKEWHEKTENERKLWKAGIAAGVLGGVGVTLVGQRLVSGKSLIPSRFMPKKVTPPDASVFVDAAKAFRAGA